MITKGQLIDFINENFDELQGGGCANYEKLYGYQEHMSLADVNACEKAITKLLRTKHKVTFKPDNEVY
jgi:hypothetical protein